MRSMLIVLGLIVASLTATLPGFAQGSGRSIAWQRFDVDLAIQTDGSVNVIETQAIQFTGTYQQGYRLVPLDRATGAREVGLAELVNGQSVQYTPGTGQLNTFSSKTGPDGLEIDWWFPPTTNASRTFEVRYTVTGALRIYDAGDQLQWRAIYADRDGAIDASTVRVHLPSDVDPTALQTAWYAYPASGSIGALRVAGEGAQLGARTVQFAIGQVPARQGAEVRVQFPHGAIAAPPPPWQAAADRTDWLAQSVTPIGDFLSLLLTFGILAGGGVFLFYVWYSNGRDPAVGAAPLELPEPPSTLPAPVAGTLVHEGASEKEAVATLVDLADRGILRVQEEHPGAQPDMRITLLKTLDDASLRPYERALLTALFGRSPRDRPNAEVLLSNVKAQFQSSIPIIEEQLSAAVVEQGFFVRNPETTRRRWRALGVALAVAGMALSVVAGVALADVVHIAWLPGLALLLVGAAGLMVANAMPRRTQIGALEAAKWRAFVAHLRNVSRAQKPGIALPAHYLPYAVAFGVDQSFLRHLESVGSEAPRWYARGGPGGVVVMPGGWYGGPWTGPRGPEGPRSSGGVGVPTAPNAQGWSDALAALLNAASEAMSHGGGHGGWSGGGFGGGGGGGGGSGGFR